MACGILLGFGTMGQTHLARYSQLGVPILAVVDPEPAAQAAAQASGLRTCAHLAEAPIDRVDFIDICTPTYLHFEQIRAAMELNLAILVEKPIVLTRDEAAALRQMHYARPVFVGEVEHYNRCFTPFLASSEQPRAIEISREVNLDFFLRGTRPWFVDERLSGGLILDCMIHDLNLLVCKYGVPRIDEVQGRAARYGTLDEAMVSLGYPGFTAKVRCIWTAERTSTPIVTRLAFQPDQGATLEMVCDDYAVRDKPRHADAFLLELAAFLGCLQTGIAPYPLSAYLDGIDLALEIRARVSMGTCSPSTTESSQPV